MTTIAWDGYKLAADSRGLRAGVPFTTTKIWKLEGGRLLAIAGALSLGVRVRYWLNGGEQPNPTKEESDGFGAILVSANKVEVTDCWLTWQDMLDQHFALGSGREFALAAMALGKTSLEAVEFAARFDIGTAKPFISYTRPDSA